MHIVPMLYNIGFKQETFTDIPQNREIFSHDRKKAEIYLIFIFWFTSSIFTATQLNQVTLGSLPF